MATKNVDPYTESEIEKLASKYSYNCKDVKVIPRIIVYIKDIIVWEWLFSIIE